MNVELLEKVKEQILKEPERFFMSDWMRGVNRTDELLTEPCGTAACIGGWACALAGLSVYQPLNAIAVHNAARDVLEISEEEADRLFYRGSWPSDLEDEWDETDEDEDRPLRAQIAARRIDLFIESESAF